MKRSILAILCLAAAAIDAAPSRACTSVIVSSKATRDGRPLMFKHRDTNTLDNRMEFCHGPRFRFIAVVNSDTKGGAAYYEICNYSWVKFDVNDSSVAPEGYMYYTNFSRSGVEGEYHGWERFLTAGDIMKTIPRDASAQTFDVCIYLPFCARCPAWWGYYAQRQPLQYAISLSSVHDTHP